MADFLTNPDNYARYKSRDTLIAFAIILTAVIVTLVLCYEHSFKDHHRQRSQRLLLPALPKPQKSDTRPEHMEHYERIDVKIEQGSRLNSILAAHKIDHDQIKALTALGRKTPQLKTLKAYHKLELFINKQTQRLAQLNYYYGGTNMLIVTLNNDTINSKIVKQKLEPHLHFAAGAIRNSLYQAAEQAGLSEKLIYQLIRNFSWDIDFHKDIHPGDRFVVLYEDYYLQDKKVNEGNILAALFLTRGKTFTAIRHTDKQGHTEYYAADGKNIRTAFLRAPLHYRRISSPFNLFRMHPVLHHIKPHRGVDYAAPWGTPIKATGDGKVLFIGRKGGYGNTIKLRHGSRYETLYAHLSRYARHLRVGQYIKQGQIIGYVGKTGMATGPHVHYEFHIDGRHVNPTTTRLPHAKPVPRQELKTFANKAKTLLAELKLYLQSLDGHYAE